MQPKCPHCGSIIYSRRNVLCGVCGQRLPKDLLFTAEERKRIDSELEEAKRRERAAARRMIEQDRNDFRAPYI